MVSIKMPDGISTPEDQLQIATATVEDYLSGPAPDIRKAQIAVQQMHSMQDWTIKHRLTNFGCKDEGDFRNRIYMAEPRLAIVRDFANATKHGGYLKYPNRVLDEVKKDGPFSRAFSHQFNRARLELHIISEKATDFKDHLQKGKYLDTDETFKSCLQFWTDLYKMGRMLSKRSECQEAGSTDGTDRQRITLPDEIDSTTKQLDIAIEMVDSTSRESTVAATYLTATTIAPLERWAYEDLKGPMEFPNNKEFRRYVYRESPGIRAIRELAQAAKSGARIIFNAGRMEIVLRDNSMFDPTKTFEAAISFWQRMLSEYTKLQSAVNFP